MPSMAKLVAAIASARVPLVLMYHSQSVSDCTSRNSGLFPSARSSMSCLETPKPWPIHNQCSACAFSTRMLSIRKDRA